MQAESRLNVVICWHMHQPCYQDLLTGEYAFPWTYLHAIKDYVDMAAHLELQDEARAVVNFAPVLIEQITDYVAQVDAFLAEGVPLSDPLLNALVSPVLPTPGSEQGLALAQACLRANHKRIITRFPPYSRLAGIAQQLLPDPAQACYLSSQFLADLLVWYHLGWMAETVRRSDAAVLALQEKGQGYDERDRRQLLLLIGDLMRGILPRYRALADSGKVELAMSPYAHPILPLLLDFSSAREAFPESGLPASPAYPGGEARARWQLEQGRKVFHAAFGREPAGCWPSEGAISQPSLDLLSSMGFQWAASGDAVLRNSLKRAPDVREHADEHLTHHRPLQFDGASIRVFFRDDGLSDLIGFTYADWHADDAVGDLVNHLAHIAQQCPDPSQRVVSIIMDGENAWEYYPENAYYLLSQLYRRIAAHPLLRLTTFEEACRTAVAPLRLPTLVSGSWVYGTLSTWMGDKDKNRGWDLLCEAKTQVDLALRRGGLSVSTVNKILTQLAWCEGSDWFWWFGDYNPRQSVQDFERLFRRHLRNLYALINVPPPASLDQPISQGGGNPALGGVMRSSQGGT